MLCSCMANTLKIVLETILLIGKVAHIINNNKKKKSK